MLGPGVSPVKRQVFFLWLVADQYAQAKAAEGPISPQATERTLICFNGASSNWASESS